MSGESGESENKIYKSGVSWWLAGAGVLCGLLIKSIRKLSQEMLHHFLTFSGVNWCATAAQVPELRQIVFHCFKSSGVGGLGEIEVDNSYLIYSFYILQRVMRSVLDYHVIHYNV